MSSDNVDKQPTREFKGALTGVAAVKTKSMTIHAAVGLETYQDDVRHRMYKYYNWKTIFGTFEEFNEVMTNCTRNHILDKELAGKSLEQMKNS